MHTEGGVREGEMGGEREMYRGLWEENVRKGQLRGWHVLRESKGASLRALGQPLVHSLSVVL